MKRVLFLIPILSLSLYSTRCSLPVKSGETPERSVLLIKAVGDLNPGTDFPQNRLNPDPARLFDGVGQDLEGADLLIGNFESTMTDYPRTYKNVQRAHTFAFRTPPSYGTLLRGAGFDVLNVANNHSFDFMEQGFLDTMENIDRAGMTAVGRKGEILYRKVKGVSAAFIGFSYSNRHNNLHDLEGAAAMVREAASKASFVVVTFHGGAEGPGALHVRNEEERYLGEYRGNLVRFAHTLVDAGADLILGSGPHVPRAMEIYRGRLVAYSLGNFMGYRTLAYAGVVGKSLILEAKVDREGRFLSGRILPVTIRAPGLPHSDAEGESVDLVRTLSRSDFPDSPLVIGEDGGIRMLPKEVTVGKGEKDGS